ncbi:MAG: hypothetical protein KY461_09590, partial [Actinobacteria bacterium]|nr:hypothetical protein [Actinomycetota bacterium]
MAERLSAVSPPSLSGAVPGEIESLDAGSPSAASDPILAMEAPPGCKDEVIGIVREVTVDVDP